MTTRPVERACDFCGLPLAGLRVGMAAGGETSRPEYCCLGCRFAAAVVRERGAAGAANWTLVRLGLSIFLSLNVMAFTMALWSRDIYGEGATTSLSAPLESVLRYLCLLFSLPVLYLLGLPLAASAWDGLLRRRPSTDLLLTIGVAAAFAYSAVSVVRDAGSIYFEVACVILVLVTLGRWLEATGKAQAGATLDALEKLLPDGVRRLDDGGEALVTLEQIRIGDRLRVIGGERFPADAQLLDCSAVVDEQIITGESQPVWKQPGEMVYGATLNLDGTCLITVSTLPREGTLGRLVEAVRRAREEKGHYQQLADRLAACALPAVGALAIAAFTIHALRSGLDGGLMAGLAVLLVACPCALGLATPLAVWSALGKAAGQQVLFRSAAALEQLAGIRAIRLDKTGTLTTGTARVAKFAVADPDSGAESLWRAAVLASHSSHPFCAAIREFAHSPDEGQSATAVKLHAGRGISAAIGDGAARTFLGSRQLMDEASLACNGAAERASDAAVHAGQSLACVGWDGCVRAVFSFDEQLRSSAQAALDLCRQAGLDIAVVTGDQCERGRAMQEALGVPVEAGLLPEAKVAAIREARRRFGPVAMVGDGINDAPALAASDVGVALGCGADVSRDSAAVCLLGNDLTRLPWAIDFARRTVHTIRRNLIWAFVYNSVGIGLAVAGWLNPAIAALLMVCSSTLVIRNALAAGRDRETGIMRADSDAQRSQASRGDLPDKSRRPVTADAFLEPLGAAPHD